MRRQRSCVPEHLCVSCCCSFCCCVAAGLLLVCCWFAVAPASRVAALAAGAAALAASVAAAARAASVTAFALLLLQLAFLLLLLPSFVVAVEANGKIMATGANSVLGLRVAMLKVARRLRALGVVGQSTRLSSFRVGNLLASYALPFPLQLQQLAALAAAHHIQLDIDPERFPGARIKVPIGAAKEAQEGPAAGAGGDLGAWTRSSGQAGVGRGPERKAEVVTLHAFSSGRITITGARSAASLQQALVSVLPLLLRCPGQQVQPAALRGAKSKG
ncbi:hypothetical protein Esti_001619 [Eimeria stiedai]